MSLLPLGQEKSLPSAKPKDGRRPDESTDLIDGRNFASQGVRKRKVVQFNRAYVDYWMRFIPGGPEIDDELIAQQERGEVLFICGSGVSRSVGLPDFRGLVEEIYKRLGERWENYPPEYEVMRANGQLHGQYDRVLRFLEKRLAASDVPQNRAMRDRMKGIIRSVLSTPQLDSFPDQLALLKLSRDAEGATRIVTTNFDTVLEKAWQTHFRTPIVSHAGPALPQPRAAGFTGVLHLHGRISDDSSRLSLNETPLILTSAEFGEAYLRSGWASRYVYDLARTHTIVLVGYQAEDPPMRYLLEVLEADRERYSDLKPVYAFASRESDLKKSERLWEAKGIRPILYSADENHSILYKTLGAWSEFADNPTIWREARLKRILVNTPSATSEGELVEIKNLLGHADQKRLLDRIAPDPQWFSFFVQTNVLEKGNFPVGWITGNLSNPEMIRACASISAFDKWTLRRLGEALVDHGKDLSPTYKKAWSLILNANRLPAPDDLLENWFQVSKAIKSGEHGYFERNHIGRMLRPYLIVRRPYPTLNQEDTAECAESLLSLVGIDFAVSRFVSSREVLDAWPKDIKALRELFVSLERHLYDALEEAEEAEFIGGFDRANSDIPSIAPHKQNEHRSGFYVIVSGLEKIWRLIANVEPRSAASLIQDWQNSRFLVLKRFFLYGLAHQQAFSSTEVLDGLIGLSDFDFWSSSCQVELMRALVERWDDFDETQRNKIESRICAGIPPGLFGNDDEEDGIASTDVISKLTVLRRLHRLNTTSAQLSNSAVKMYEELRSHHEKVRLSDDDRDSFGSWISYGSGPEGSPDVLDGVPEEKLVNEAFRLQREHPFDQGNLWRILCAMDTNRALKALVADAEVETWHAGAWQTFLMEASGEDNSELQVSIGREILRLPTQFVGENLSNIASWMARRYHNVNELFFPIWDLLCEIVYKEKEHFTSPKIDILSEALNSAGGRLADVLIRKASDYGYVTNQRFSAEFRERLDKIVTARCQNGLFGRAILAQHLSFLAAVDLEWVRSQFLPRFIWTHDEAAVLWMANAYERGLVRPEIFNQMKDAFLESFQRQVLEENHWKGLISRLFQIAVWHRTGQALDYNFSDNDFRGVLAIGHRSVRHTVSWAMWRYLADHGGNADGKANLWRTVIGPILIAVWPLDASLRDGRTTENFVRVALESFDEFPNAVASIIGLLKPIDDRLGFSILSLNENAEELAARFPCAFVHLISVLVGRDLSNIPSDLGRILEICSGADPNIVENSHYIRLSGIWRRRQS